MLNFFKRQTQPLRDHLALGTQGERLTAEYLKRHGYRLVVSNFTTPIGYSLSGRQITGDG